MRKYAAYGILCFLAITSIVFILLTNVSEKTYVLREYNGNVALYENGRITKIYESVNVATLPDGDVELLKNGITLEKAEDAQSYIEDYDG